MKIMSWNVASIRARLATLSKVLEVYTPDIVLLQETKATDDLFPFLDCKTMGYNTYIAGQKAYNGVAIMSKEPLTNINITLPHFTETGDAQARFIEADMQDGTRLICVYIPNGNPPMKDPSDTSKLTYKLAWMGALTKHVYELLKSGKSVVLGGDFNVIERDGDVYNPDAYRNNALMVPSVRERFVELNKLTLHNTLRDKHPESGLYSFWDFQMGAWQRNWGMLLDHIFISNDLVGRLMDAGVLKDVRGWEKTSDHAPIWCDLK